MDLDADPVHVRSETPLARLDAHLAVSGRPRLAHAVLHLARSAHELIDVLDVDEAELAVAARWLAEVGQACDRQRQEWILLGDVLGIGARIAERSGAPEGGRDAPRGPFWRPDAPLRTAGADICLDGRGESLSVRCTVSGPAGPIEGARVETWQANPDGLYENQDPDAQPEHNLRGVFTTDADGVVHWRSVRPGPTRLPDDGPVGALMRRLGLSVERPASIHLSVSARGHRPLVTEVFDAADPRLGADPILVARPSMAVPFERGGTGWAVEIGIRLAAAEGN